MKFEHFALNVSDPVKVAAWYVTNCGMRVVKSSTSGSCAHFLADSTGRVTLEIYHNPAAIVPPYAERHPLEFHFAFCLADAEATKQKLVAAGAMVVEEIRPPDGSHLVMLRDPFGIPLQLCQRATPF